MKIKQENYTFTAPTQRARKLRVKFLVHDIIKKVLAHLSNYTLFFAGSMCKALVSGAFLMKYISVKYDKHIQLPLNLIKEAIAGNWLDSMHYYIKLKSLYTKPIFYNYSLRKLAAKLECAPSTLATHIAILSQKGLCWRDGANLRLKSIHSHRKDGGLIVPVCVSQNKAEQIMYLRYAIINRSLHNQSRTANKKNDVIKFHKGEIYDLKQVKALQKVAKSMPSLPQLESSFQPCLTLSNNKIGKLSNRSQSTGIKIQRAFNQLNLIRSIKRVAQVSIRKTNKRAFFEQVFTAKHFISDREYVFKRLSNGIEMLGGEECTIQLSEHA